MRTSSGAYLLLKVGDQIDVMWNTDVTIAVE